MKYGSPVNTPYITLLFLDAGRYKIIYNEIYWRELKIIVGTCARSTSLDIKEIYLFYIVYLCDWQDNLISPDYNESKRWVRVPRVYK